MNVQGGILDTTTLMGKPVKYSSSNPKVKQAIEWYLEGKTVKEIAQITGITERTLYRKFKEQNITRS